jgi:cell division protein FtsZ
MFKFDLPNGQSGNIIKVIGVGGGGCNAVNYMFQQQIKGVDFIVTNTDKQHLDISPVPLKIQLGPSLTQGLGAGQLPEIGRNAAIENIEDIKAILSYNTKMVFITAGMGGGTGTGAAPVIAQVAKEMGILTVGIVTMPFSFEGKSKKMLAEQGLENMRNVVDTLLVINNDKLREMYGNLTLSNAFAHADEVLNTAARGIAEMISITGSMNVDFNDVNTIMRGSGVAIMGIGSAEGENRATIAAEKALSSPLLNDNNIYGAKYVLINITYGSNEVTMDEIGEIVDYMQQEAGATADVKWGHAYDETMGDKISLTVIATGFNRNNGIGIEYKAPEKKYISLETDMPTMITQPISSPTQIVSNSSPVNTETVEKPADEPYLLEKNENTIISANEENKIEFEIEIPKNENQTIFEPFVNNENSSVLNTSSEDLNTTKNEEVKTEIVRHWLTEEEPENEIKNETVANQATLTQTEYGNQEIDTHIHSESNEDSDEKNLSLAEQQKLANERLARIRELTAKLKTHQGLSEMENEPAYKRRNFTLFNQPDNNDTSTSKFNIAEKTDENGNKTTGLKPNNSFLHGNVD